MALNATQRTDNPAPRSRPIRWRSSLPALLLALMLAVGSLAALPARADEATPVPDVTGSELDDSGTPTPEPTATSTVTPEPTVTETATTEPTATNTPELAPTATSTAAPEPTATSVPIATGTPTTGRVELTFAEERVAVDPGSAARFTLTIENGDVPQTVDLAASSANDWTIAIVRPAEDAAAQSLTVASTSLAAGAETPVTDTDGDKRTDVGYLRAGERITVIVVSAAPKGAPAGLEDTLTVRVPGQAGVRARAFVNPVVTVTIAGDAAFGTVDMLGTVDPSIPGLTSSTDQTGSTYIKTGAASVTVTSDAPWTLRCSLLDWQGPAVLAWRISGTETWNTFATTEAGQICASGPATSGEPVTVTFDLMLRVNAGDPAQSLAGTIRFSWDN